MPTDQTHLVAFLVALSGTATIGVGAFVYIWRATPKRKPDAEQPSFDFMSQPIQPPARKVQAPPMAHV